MRNGDIRASRLMAKSGFKHFEWMSSVFISAWYSHVFFSQSVSASKLEKADILELTLHCLRDLQNQGKHRVHIYILLSKRLAESK